MLFTDISFWGFFAAVFAVYWLLPHRLRWLGLLAVNIIFYIASGSAALAFALVIPVLGSWGIAFALEKLRENQTVRRLLLAGGVILCLSFLLFYKYAGFLCGLLRLPIASQLYLLALPFGISYYTLQTVSYLADVAAGRCAAERHLGYYAVSVTFFPLMVTGPVERPRVLLAQLRTPRCFDADTAERGVILIVWGLFEKLTVANILGSFVDAGFNNPAAVTGVSLLICAVLYSFQIYCDFAGYSNLARGCALMLGLSVTQNFRQPYFAGSFKELWSRWHISLSTWLRDYVYIPLGGSRCSMLRQCLNLMITFVVSGLWHGANLCFLVWGALHGLYQCIGKLTGGLRARFWAKAPRLRDHALLRALRVLFVFTLTTFAWIFFRVGSGAQGDLAGVGNILCKIADDFTLQLQPWKDALVLLAFDIGYLLRLGLMVLFIGFVDWKSRLSSVEDWTMSLRPGVRLLLGWALALCILFFGVDTGAPIYFKF